MIHNDKETAISQINAIHSILQGDLKGFISGSKMIVTGALIMAIPLIELFFSKTIDPLLLANGYPDAGIFIMRSLFYWTLFGSIGRFFPSKKTMNTLLTNIWSVGKYFAIIPFARATMLASTGNTVLIAPMVLTLCRSLLLFLGKFSDYILTLIAWAFIIGGLVEIELTTYTIPHLWMYLVAYQGFGYIIIGLTLSVSQKSNAQ